MGKSLLKVGGTVNTRRIRKAPIGVFDSGVGGLTVARRSGVSFRMRYLCILRSARLPYGSKSKESIIRFAKQIIRFRRRKKLKQSSSHVIRDSTGIGSRAEGMRYPIIGVIEPGHGQRSKDEK